MDEATAAIFEAIADCKGVDSTELHVPLYDVLDPDALDTLLEAAGPIRVSFGYDGLWVTVDGTGEVLVTPVEGPECGVHHDT